MRPVHQGAEWVEAAGADCNRPSETKEGVRGVGIDGIAEYLTETPKCAIPSSTLL
jgi:hypothetical protein